MAELPVTMLRAQGFDKQIRVMECCAHCCIHARGVQSSFSLKYAACSLGFIWHGLRAQKEK
jgi:hypothetical protein